MFFYQLFLAIIVFLPNLKTRRSAFSQKIRSFLKLVFLDLEDIDLGSPELPMIEIFSQPTSHKNLVILAFIGAELAGAGQILPPPPSRARNSGPHSRARVKGPKVSAAWIRLELSQPNKVLGRHKLAVDIT